MLYITIAFLAFIFTVLITQFAIGFLTSRGIVDNPNDEKRKLHSVPVPRLGGVVLFSVVIIITFLFYGDPGSKLFFIAGVLVIFFLGVWDDLKRIKWYFKFIFQSVSVIFLILSLHNHNFGDITFAGYVVPPGLNYLLLFGMVLGIINSFNLLDGLDGLVAGLTIIISSMCLLIGISFGYVFLPILAASLIGSLLGFLKFNANPARIFLGDSGSLTLGYFAAGMLLVISSPIVYFENVNKNIDAFSIDLLTIIIILAVPIIDTLRVMYMRFRNKKNLFLPDSTHIHHIFYSKKIQHQSVVLVVNGLSVVFALIGLNYIFTSKLQSIVFFLIMLVVFLNSGNIIDIIIRKDNLLAYGRLYRKIPHVLPRIFLKVILPASILFVLAIILFLMFKEIHLPHDHDYYLVLVLIPSFIYATYILKTKYYYVELLVFMNLLLFFLLTGFDNFFYKLYPMEILFIKQININQIFIFILSLVVIYFTLFKELIITRNGKFLTGIDLSIALCITFVYLMNYFTKFPDGYKISDVLLKSYLVFLLYKMIVMIFPKTHFILYYASFAVSIIAILNTII